MKHRAVVLLSLGHAVTDINQGALPALLPFLIAA
jgi:FSR family fosmidomycin resistance protein-like MFS transporter